LGFGSLERNNGNLNRPATSIRDAETGPKSLGHDETLLSAVSRKQPGRVSHSRQLRKAMKCSEIQSDLALHAVVASSDTAGNSAVDDHVKVCPVCRDRYADLRELNTGLRQMPRSEISAALRNSIKQNVRAEIRASQNKWMPISRDVREWLMLRFMPYSVGLCTSLLVAVAFLTMMSSGMLGPRHEPSSIGRGDTFLLASNRDPFGNSGVEISPSEYAKSRLGFADESPSINPKGALVALTRSLVHGGMKDDEVVNLHAIAAR